MKGLRVFAVCLLVLAAGSHRAAAQTLTNTDSVMTDALKKGQAVIFLDWQIAGHHIVRRCLQAAVTLGISTGGSPYLITSVGLFSPSYFGVIGVPPGDVIIGNVSCRAGGTTRVYNGTFAKMRVKAGEIVNAGTLVLDFMKLSDDRSAKISIAPLRPETVADMKTRAPQTFPKAKVRLMTPTRPVAEFKPRSFF